MTGAIKENWGKLTDDEIQQAEGNYDQLVGKIQERYGIGKAEAKRQVDEFTPAGTLKSFPPSCQCPCPKPVTEHCR